MKTTATKVSERYCVYIFSKYLPSYFPSPVFASHSFIAVIPKAEIKIETIRLNIDGILYAIEYNPFRAAPQKNISIYLSDI